MTEEELLKRYRNSFGSIDWLSLSCHSNLSEEFIEKYYDKVFWSRIIRYQKLSEAFIERWRNKVYIEWDLVSSHQELSEEFIERHIHKLKLGNIFLYQKLSIEFLERHKNHEHFSCIYENNKIDLQYKLKKKIEFGVISKEDSTSYIERTRNTHDINELEGLL